MVAHIGHKETLEEADKELDKKIWDHLDKRELLQQLQTQSNQNVQQGAQMNQSHDDIQKQIQMLVQSMTALQQTQQNMSAMQSQQSQYRQQNNQRPNPKTCNYCKKPGHFWRQCHAFKKDVDEGRTDPNMFRRKPNQATSSYSNQQPGQYRAQFYPQQNYTPWQQNQQSYAPTQQPSYTPGYAAAQHQTFAQNPALARAQESQNLQDKVSQVAAIQQQYGQFPSGTQPQQLQPEQKPTVSFSQPLVSMSGPAADSSINPDASLQIGDLIGIGTNTNPGKSA